MGFLSRVLTGVTVRYVSDDVFRGSRVYIANHSSHLDFLVIWSVLPPLQRDRTFPVAARDYWDRGPLRRCAARRLFHARLIQRGSASGVRKPLQTMLDVIARGDSLIVFPEGTRNADGNIQPFKPGIHFLASRSPGVSFVPVWLENLNRILPKGEFLPVPLACSVTFGRAFHLRERESRDEFLARAEREVRALSGMNDVD